MLPERDSEMLVQDCMREHITPVLKSFYWLPIRSRIDFKVLPVVSRCPNGLGPSYLSDLLLDHKPSQTLRCSGTGILIVPKLGLKPMVKPRFHNMACRRTSGLRRMLKTGPRLTFLIWLLSDILTGVSVCVCRGEGLFLNMQIHVTNN